MKVDTEEMEAIEVAMELEVVVDDEMMEAGNGVDDEG